MAIYIIRILLFLFGIYLLRWFLAGFKKSAKKGEAGDGGNNASKMVKDPMCGMYMDERLAIRLDNRKEIIYFCSEECKKQYATKSTNEGIGSAFTGHG
jgi:YHS domain-containing protein